MIDKKADLAGPGIGGYEELERILPTDYQSLLRPKDTQSGVNDYLDRDGARTPVQFHISNDRDKHPIDAQVVQAATKWKSVALKRFGMEPGEGLCTDMRAIARTTSSTTTTASGRSW